MVKDDILTWDWRYQIGLKPDLKQEVVNKIARLPHDYKLIYEEFIAYFDELVSMDVILETFASEVGKTWEELSLLSVEDLREKMIFIPPLLRPRMERKMTKVKLDNPQISTILDDLYFTACKKGIVPNYRRGFDILFGDALDDVLMYAEQCQQPSQTMHKDEIEPGAVLPFAKRILTNIVNDKGTNQRFGSFDVEDYDITLREQEDGFAEWWAKEINDKDVDELVLIVNEHSMNEQDLELTLYHEVYPGHGHFYEYARNKREHAFFDHGAFSLIEGWATYAEWHTVNHPYVLTLKERAANHLQLIMESGKREVATILEELYENQSQRSSKAQAEYSLLYFSQYPGYIESYYLGAFWLELQLENKVYDSPFHFLQAMTSRPWGDFFKLW